MKHNHKIQREMKNLLLVTALMFTAGLSFGQNIADVSKSSDGRLTVWNSTCNEIARKYTFDGDVLSGFSPEVIVVTSKNNHVIVYNQNFNEISSKYLYEGDQVKHVCGDNIVVRNKNGLVTIYDLKFNERAHRYE